MYNINRNEKYAFFLYKLQNFFYRVKICTKKINSYFHTKISYHK